MFAAISVAGLEVKYGRFTRCHFLPQQTSHNACSRYVISTCHLVLTHRQDRSTCEYILNSRSLSKSLWVLRPGVTTHRSGVDCLLPCHIEDVRICACRVLLACPNCRLWCLWWRHHLTCHLTWSTALHLACPCVEMLSNGDSAVGTALSWMTEIAVQFWNRKEIFLFSIVHLVPPEPTQSPVLRMPVTVSPGVKWSVYEIKQFHVPSAEVMNECTVHVPHHDVRRGNFQWTVHLPHHDVRSGNFQWTTYATS
jgi:hypothetical protein